MSSALSDFLLFILTTMKGKMRKWWLIFLLCIIHTTNGSTEEKCLQDMEEVYPKKYFQYRGQSLPVNLDTSSRTTHQLSTHIFYIYVKEVLGYSKVDITHSEDHFQIESAIARLSDYVDHGRAKNETIPPATINLEVWVSPDYDTFAKELVKECGSVGPPGRFGWFIPKNLSTPVKAYYRPADWTEDIQEVHWTLFMDEEMVGGFNIDKKELGIIESKGYNKNQSEYICNDPNICKESMYTPKQCQNVTCAVLLAPEFNSTSFLINQINETNLLVKVLWLGDNLKTVIETLEHRYRNTNSNSSLLFFYWYPSEIVLQEENYINVQFKNNEFYNFTHEKSVGYKYEMHRLVKLAWGKMALNAEPLYLGLRHFKLEDKDYDFLLGRYVTTNYTIRQIACDWMKANEHVWRNNWKVANEKQTIHIGGIFPMSATSYNGRGIALGARLATTAINREKELLKGYNLNLIVTDGQCQPDTVMKNFIDFIVTPTYYQNLVGVLGPACSETVEPIAGVSKHYHVLIVSYSAEGASFSDRGKYPYFFRTIGENRHYKHVYLKLFERFGWRRVAALTEDGQKYTEYISLMSDDLEKSGVKFIANKKFPREKSGEDMKYYLADLKSLRARIIIADVVDNVARAVMCEAYKQEMTAAQGYVWFLPIWLDTKWYDTDYYNKQNENVSCSTEEMKHAIKGFFAMTHTYYAADSSLMQENITVGKWREKHEKSLNWSNYAGFAYDAVWTYAFALDKLSTTDPEAMSDLHSENTTNKLVRMVEATDFQGLSGHIKFRGGPSRFSNISIVQWYDDKFNTIGFFYPNLTEHKPEILGGLLNLSDTAIKWFTDDGKVPEDGTLPPPSCAVESLARIFDVECQTAVIILNVIVAGVLLIGVVGVCLYMKRKYDMKVQRTKNYMKALGFPFDPRNCSDLDRWETDRKAVFINRKIGEGAFGTVYGGDAEIRDVGYTAVAVKTLKVGSTAEEKLDFLSEAEAMKRFDHKNIVKLLGVCTKEEPVLAIMEFMLYGDLKCYLLARRHLVKSTKFTEAADEVSPKRLTNMALDVARGLSYLADLKFVHRDIASRNCLVNAQRTIKIGDFGMTRAMFDSDYYKFTRRGMLPVRWMSPESLALGVFTPASDVWSFGVLLYEIVTFGSIPFQGMSNSQVLDLVKEGHVLDIPKGLKPQLAGLIKSCWKQEAKERPTASQMVEFIANNPRLLTPCLDAPISSVQVGDSDQMEMSCRNFPKVSPRKSCNGRALQTQNFNFEDKHDLDNIPMEICCPKEPLLGQGKSSSSNLLSRLVVGSRRESEDDDDPNRNVSDKQDNTNV